MGLTLRFENDRPVVIVRGVSLGGIPLPGAWWGDIKNRDLVEESGREGAFWDLFAKGVDDLQVRDGRFVLHLKD
ncbi:MAG: hypothetical protein KJ626_16245 [Verrucomicrobia bacterium]|nr:hypothetical protein [Verrucomicrobiota bacterium]